MTPLAKVLGILAVLGSGLDFNDDAPLQPLERNYGHTCLALVGFSEARDQSDEGLSAVMRVVINRATDPAHRWPQSLCDVALQPGQFIGVDRWPVPRHPERIDAKQWQRALDMADRVIAGTAPVPFFCLFATGFDQDPPRPNRGVVCRVGAHTFYVEPSPQVIAGSRRLRALRKLIEIKALPEDYEVPCRLIDESQALTASLAENAIREPMHPADEFVAFRQMIESGKSIEAIAARFGVTPLVVQRRLKLANVAPSLFERFRTDQISIEQMMALAIVDDHKQQERVWANAKHEWQREPARLREALTPKEIDAAESPLAKFVGLDEYERAGGVVHRDIFNERSGYIKDATLLKTLAAKKLDALAQTIRKEGWSFVEVLPERPSYEYFQQFTRVQPSGQRKPVDVERKRISELTAERATAEKRFAQIEKKSAPTEAEEIEAGELEDRIVEIGNELSEIEQSLGKWDAKILAKGGVIITLDTDGSLDVRRGMVKGKYKQARDTKASAAKSGKAAEAAKLGHSENLTRELTAHATFAIAAEMIAGDAGHGMAIIALTHRLLIDQFYTNGSADPVAIHHPSNYPAKRTQADRAEGFEITDSPDIAKLATERAAIKALLPKKPAELFAWLLGIDGKTLRRALAYCIAESLDCIVGDESHNRAAPLGKALKVDMRTRWSPRRANYLGRVTSPQILAALKESGALAKMSADGQADKLKKSELIDLAEPLLANWLPKPLRFE